MLFRKARRAVCFASLLFSLAIVPCHQEKSSLSSESSSHENRAVINDYKDVTYPKRFDKNAFNCTAIKDTFVSGTDTHDLSPEVIDMVAAMGDAVNVSG